MNSVKFIQDRTFTISENLTIDLKQLDSTVLEETLIEEVRKKPPINDYMLLLFVHGRQKIADLWMEISEALNDN